MSAPRRVTAMAGYDAIAHAVETWVTIAAHADVGHVFAARVGASARHRSSACLTQPGDRDARAAMLLGVALRRHRHRAIDARRRACVREPADRALRPRARPGARRSCCRTSSAGTAPVAGRSLRCARWMRERGRSRSAWRANSRIAAPEGWAAQLHDHGVHGGRAAQTGRARGRTQWTGTFNPRPFDAAGARDLPRGVQSLVSGRSHFHLKERARTQRVAAT